MQNVLYVKRFLCFDKIAIGFIIKNIGLYLLEIIICFLNEIVGKLLGMF